MGVSPRHRMPFYNSFTVSHTHYTEPGARARGSNTPGQESAEGPLLVTRLGDASSRQ